MAFPILIAVIPVIKVAATAAAAAIARRGGTEGRRDPVRPRARPVPAFSNTFNNTGRRGHCGSPGTSRRRPLERAKTAEQALCQERAMRRTLARVALPGATLAALAAGMLIGWLLIP